MLQKNTHIADEHGKNLPETIVSLKWIVFKLCHPAHLFPNTPRTFAETPNVGWIFRVIWKDLPWTAESYRLLKYRGRYTIALFQISLWCENGVPARLFSVICKQLLILNDRNMVRLVVLGLPQAGAYTDLFENLSEISLKGQCHEIFCFWFFSWTSFPQASDFTIRAVSNFCENSRRYSQLKVCHRCQRHDTGGKWKKPSSRKILII